MLTANAHVYLILFVVNLEESYTARTWKLTLGENILTIKKITFLKLTCVNNWFVTQKCFNTKFSLEYYICHDVLAQHCLILLHKLHQNISNDIVNVLRLSQSISCNKIFEWSFPFMLKKARALNQVLMV